LKQNTSDVFVEGIIDKKISSSEHIRGCFVQLKDRTKGRVHELISHNLSTAYVAKPEDGFLEYKERFVLSPDEIKSHPKGWIVPHSVYKTIAAFANSEGGKLVIGIHDKGEFIGLQRDYDALNELKKIGQFTFSPDRDGFELKIKADLAIYFPGRERFVLDLIDEIKFISESGKEICEIYVVPSYEDPVILFEKYSNINKQPDLYQIKARIIEEALVKQKLEHDPTQKSYTLTTEKKKRHDESKTCHACFPELNMSQRIKLNPNYEILIKDLTQMNQSNEHTPKFFVRKSNSSENYTAKDFIEYWVRRMKKSFTYR
jgi:hypothetical protein